MRAYPVLRTDGNRDTQALCGLIDRNKFHGGDETDTVARKRLLIVSAGTGCSERRLDDRICSEILRSAMDNFLQLENRNTGEILRMRRVRDSRGPNHFGARRFVATASGRPASSHTFPATRRRSS